MASILTEAPKEPTSGDVLIAIETLRNAGAAIETERVDQGDFTIFRKTIRIQIGVV